jgi:hypothetical protein
VIPTNAHELRLARLREANRIRALRSHLKQQIANGKTTLAETLLADHDWLRTMRVVQLLRVTPGLGPVRVNRVMIALSIGNGLTLEHFPTRRRTQLLEWLSTYCPSARIGS